MGGRPAARRGRTAIPRRNLEIVVWRSARPSRKCRVPAASEICETIAVRLGRETSARISRRVAADLEAYTEGDDRDDPCPEFAPRWHGRPSRSYRADLE